MPDTQAAYPSLKPQTALMRAARGMSRTIDSRRPRKLTPAQQAEVGCLLEVEFLQREPKTGVFPRRQKRDPLVRSGPANLIPSTAYTQKYLQLDTWIRSIEENSQPHSH